MFRLYILTSLFKTKSQTKLFYVIWKVNCVSENAKIYMRGFLYSQVSHSLRWGVWKQGSVRAYVLLVRAKALTSDDLSAYPLVGLAANSEGLYFYQHLEQAASFG